MKIDELTLLQPVSKEVKTDEDVEGTIGTYLRICNHLKLSKTNKRAKTKTRLPQANPRVQYFAKEKKPTLPTNWSRW